MRQSQVFKKVSRRLEASFFSGEGFEMSGKEARAVYVRLCRLSTLEMYLRGGSPTELRSAVALAAKPK